MNDPYRVLGISEKAPHSELKKRYRELSRRHHPDSSIAPDAARMAEISAAWELLRTVDARAATDATLVRLRESRRVEEGGDGRSSHGRRTPSSGTQGWGEAGDPKGAHRSTPRQSEAPPKPPAPPPRAPSPPSPPRRNAHHANPTPPRREAAVGRPVRRRSSALWLWAATAVLAAAVLAGQSLGSGDGNTSGNDLATSNNDPTAGSQTTHGAGASLPVPTATAAPTAPPDTAQAAPAPAQTAPATTVPTGPFQVIVDDSAPDSDTPEDGTLQVRFWRYQPPDFRQLGSGYSGGSQGVDQLRGDCSTPYAAWLAEGVPQGRYRIETFIPDIEGLSNDVNYGDYALDQSSNRGRWVGIGETQANESASGSWAVSVQQSSGEYTSGDACVSTGQVVSYDAVRFTLIG